MGLQTPLEKYLLVFYIIIIIALLVACGFAIYSEDDEFSQDKRAASVFVPLGLLIFVPIIIGMLNRSGKLPEAWTQVN
jgi:hypothetical protein